MVQTRQAADKSPIDSEENHTVLPRDEARQGVTGHNVRYVLAFGTLGIVVLFLVLLTAYMSGGHGPQ